MSTHFQIEPAYADALRAAGLDSFDALMAACGGEPTSLHANRETIPIDISVQGEPRRFFLKRTFRVPLKHTLAPLLRGRFGRSQPLMEWIILGELRSAGITAMERIAVGERRMAGCPLAACLLVAAVPASKTLDEYLTVARGSTERLDARQRGRLLASLGELVGRLVRRGIHWPDFQAKHVFAEPLRAGSHWALWLIDVERMQCRNPAEPMTTAVFAASAWRLLARLRRSCPMARFSWRDYLHVAVGLRRNAAHDLLRFRQSERSHENDLAGAFRTLETLPAVPDDEQAHIGVDRVDGYSLHADFAELFGAHKLDSFDRIFNVALDADLHKPGLKSHRSRGRFSLTGADGRTHTFYIKRYDRPPTADQLQRIITGQPADSSATREFRFIRRLNKIGLSTLRCVAVGQRMIGLTERQSFLITAGLDDLSLERYVANIIGGTTPPPAPDVRHEIIRQLARVAHTLHGAQFFHRDFYLSHVFLHHNADGSIALRLIDLARMLARPRTPLRWKVKDLAALEYSAPRPLVTRADRIRFLRNYLGTQSASRHTGPSAPPANPIPPGSSRAEEKQLLRYHIRIVAARVRKMADHDARRSRRNTPA